MLIKRTTSTGANDLHTTYRPCTVDEIVGLDINKRVIKKGLDDGTLSHSMIFTGAAGCGKTTTARVIALGLNCKHTDTMTSSPCLECATCKSILNHSNLDVVEVNVGKDSGKAAVNNIVDDLAYAPMNNRYKILIFDEAHELTKSAQNLLLKIIEDGYSHVYFIFCTNKPEKLEDAFLKRNKIMNFSPLPIELITPMLKNICDFEGVAYTESGINLIANASMGVPRDSIVLLKSVLDEGSWDDNNIKYLVSNQLLDEDDPNVMELCGCLQKASFKGALNVLTKLKIMPDESIRIAIAGYFTRRLTWEKSYDRADKYSAILDIVTVPIGFTGKPARHILTNYLYKIVRILN